MTQDSNLILASASPRRLELLRQIGIDPVVRATDIIEQQAPGESAIDYSRRIARAKALAGRESSPAANWVLGADTEVVLDGVVLGKPCDEADALRMLCLLQGRSHQVLSSVALIGADFDEVLSQTTTVRMAAIGEAVLRAYVLSGEPMGKAGAYAIQGKAASFIEFIEGSYSGVMGLPLSETASLLRRAGLF